MRRSMDDGKRFYDKPDFWPRLVGGILILVFIAVFRAEILLVLRLMIFLTQVIINRPGNPPSTDFLKASVVLVINLAIFLACYFITLRWISLFVLPAQNSTERQHIYDRMINSISRIHEPAVFIRNGELITRTKGKVGNESNMPRYASLALVDLASAIVLERRSTHTFMDKLMEAERTGGNHPPMRVLGPGIGFLRPGEMIRGSVDLRKQIRIQKGVHGFTSDGIELQTNVHVVFTLGQAPQVLMVINTKQNGLRVMTIDWNSNIIMGVDGEIDEEDKNEIRSQIFGNKRPQSGIQANGNTFSDRPPYIIDDDRIIAAVIFQPRNTRDGKLEKWTDLPVRVAASVLLDELSRVSYDQLYSLDHLEPNCYLYDQFKPEFMRKVINLGVLSYQFVQRKDGRNPVVDSLFKPEEYVFWDVMELHNSKPLRDRGVKVIEVGLSDFKPIDNTIPEQRFDNWRSQWQKKTEITNAEYDREIIRETNHTRAQAQREIIYNLSQIFKLPGYTQEAMAIRIFQALESAAANPATSRLLPRDTVDMLKNFQHILFPQDRDGRFPDKLPPEGSK